MNPLVPTFMDFISLIAGTAMTAGALAVPILLAVLWWRQRKARMTSRPES
ncbi:hypothetical protein HNR17_000117 [Galbitalea soli]|nr:hypothetical protein [Galbitalea soli]